MAIFLPTKTPTEVVSESKPVLHPWRVVAGVCIQRFPTLTPDKTDLEQRFEEMQSVMRVERSRLSDFELEEAEYLRKKKERERKAQEEDLEELQVHLLIWLHIWMCFSTLAVRGTVDWGLQPGDPE